MWARGKLQTLPLRPPRRAEAPRDLMGAYTPGSRPGFGARFGAQIHGDYWYSLVPIGTRRSSAVPTSTNEYQ